MNESKRVLKNLFNKFEHFIGLDSNLTNDIVDVGVGGQVHFNYVRSTPKTVFLMPVHQQSKETKNFKEAIITFGGRIQTTFDNI